jgi:autophagy-related protein 11
LKDSLEQERSKLAGLKAELAEERAEMRSLREKFAAGETGSGALKQQLHSEEQRVAELMERKAEDEGANQRLKNDIDSLKQEVKTANERQATLKEHLDRRGEKAKHLSERLFHHHDRIIRMLEQFGYSLSRQDDVLVIQRASKVNAGQPI